MTTLRDRNRRATMDHIQQTAFGLFERFGYPAVTIAAITREAGVSESTFYRLFRTKEGLFTEAPWEAGPVLEGGNVAALAASLRALAADHTWPGMRWVIEEPEVRNAVLAALDQLALHLADQIHPAHASAQYTAVVATRALLFGVYFTALEQWHAEGGRRPYTVYYDALLEGSGLRGQ